MVASRLFWVAVLVHLVCGCSGVPQDAHKIDLTSANPTFLDDVFESHRTDKQEIEAYLRFPENTALDTQIPALVMLHSAQGLGTLEWHYADIFRNSGFAVLLVDSFRSRGLGRIREDQTRVSEATILTDAFAALAYLAKHRQIDPDRIGVVGFSKGGMPALYSANSGIAGMIGAQDFRFAAHVAYYPWCGLSLHDQALTGAPIIVHSGKEDAVTPASLCEDHVDRLRNASRDEQQITLYTYADARHAFDHPLLPSFPPLGVSYLIPRNCRISENANGHYVEEHTKRPVSSENLKEVLMACSEKGASVAYNRQAAALSLKRTLEFLDRHLLAD